MGLSEDLAALVEEGAGKRRSRCSVGAALERMDDTDRSALEAQLALSQHDEHFLSAPALRRVLAANGHDVGLQQLGIHRRRQCRCVSEPPASR